MWELKYGVGKCNVCHKNFPLGTDEYNNCFVCGFLACHECRQDRIGVNPPEECPRSAKEYCLAKNHVPVCLKCLRDPQILFINEKTEGLSESVVEVFDLCVEAVILANKVFPVSPSKQSFYEDYDQNLHSESQHKVDHYQFSQNALDLLRRRYNTAGNQLQAIEKMLTEALKISIANCKEMSLFCFMFLFYAQRRREIFTTQFALFESLDDDHVFLIISPAGIKLPKDKTIIFVKEFEHNPTFKNFIICDPWKKSVFMASLYTKYISENERILKSHYSFVKLARYNSLYRRIDELWGKMPFVFD
ncbi:hypothetical protein AAEX28_10650 [Lentisphaerota bacterium WC36G]|nr:hypothetical protein LJT99_13495 [Lentisphaerae bacterium WC36]